MTRSILTSRKGRTSHFARYRQIALILLKYRLGKVLHTTGLDAFLPVRWLPSNPFHKDVHTDPERMRLALEEMGVAFVKVGQILSTRSDFVPAEYTDELARLQDSLRPLPFEVIKREITTELKRPITELFYDIEEEPVGVASIGQVHAAKLMDGTEVVIKVRKPGVVRQVAEDMDILKQVAVNAQVRWEYSGTYDLRGIAEEVSQTISDEMDYIREGHNAEHFAHFFRNNPKVKIPKVYWEYTTQRVITLGRLHGIGISNVTALKHAGMDLGDLAHRTVMLWLKMIFEDEIFHADPHPGNVFVEPDGRLGLMDFGMAVPVDDDMRANIATAIRAIQQRNVDQLMESLIDMGAAPPSGSRDPLRSDLKRMLNRYPEIAGEHIKTNISELFTVIRRNHVKLPANSVMVLKTMAMAEALGKNLYPEFDFFTELLREGRRVVRRMYSPIEYLRKWPGATMDWVFLYERLPQRIARLMKSIERGDVRFRSEVSGLETHLEHLERIANRLIIGLILASLILAITVIIMGIRLGH